MDEQLLDDFADVSRWTAVVSGQAQLELTRDEGPHGHAIRLDFDFKGGGGFVVARRELALRLPVSYALTFDVRSEAPSNKFELKLADPSGRNVWWYHDSDFEFSSPWRRVRIPSSRIEFAWGPAGGGTMSDVGAVELAIAAGLGGTGRLWISDLRLLDLSKHLQPQVRASSSAPRHQPRAGAQGSSVRGWRSAQSDELPWLSVDLQEDREIGGLIVKWDAAAAPRALAVETSADGATWTARYDMHDVWGTHSYVYLPATTTRFLRLRLEPRRPKRGVGLTELTIEPFEFSRSIDTFFRNVAQHQRRGRYPKYLYAEQTYWFPVGTVNGHGCALLNEEGMLEVGLDQFSIEPFLFIDGALITWADAAITQELERGWLPIPSSSWRAGTVGLRVTAFADDDESSDVLYARYRLRNYGPIAVDMRLFVAVRPFEVTPPWQAWHGLGGAEEVHEISCEHGAVLVDRDKTILPLIEPAMFGAATAAEGAVTEYLEAGEVPKNVIVNDAFGYASAALGFDLTLAPASHADVYVAVPFDGAAAVEVSRRSGQEAGVAAFDRACRMWERRLTKVGVTLPASASACVEALRTATGHILVQRNGPALHPGPRRYTRAWIRDGAIMTAALLRMGAAEEACEFVRWYAGFQGPQGDVPCAVDLAGPDLLPEHDSHGEFIFAIAECFRFTRDRAFLAQLWPNVLGAASAIERLRSTSLTAELETSDERAFHGLLPESVSHEGYLAHPVHAYYDDFWALRGLGDAAALARVLGAASEEARLGALCTALGGSLYRSIAATIEDRKLDYIPGSVEWADFDPAATATAMMLLDVERGVPVDVLRRTYDTYLVGFRKRRDGEIDWDKYSAYEIRIIGAFVRLGRRAAAHELLDFFLADRRPRAWNQWPEISWRNPKSPGHLGDVPHTWIAAEYVLAFLGMFAFERIEDDALVLAAGIAEDWVDDRGVGVEDLPTYYGPLTYTLRREGPRALHMSIESSPHTMPASIVIRPPLAQALLSVEVDGRNITTFDAASVTISQWPAHVVMRT